MDIVSASEFGMESSQRSLEHLLEELKKVFSSIDDAPSGETNIHSYQVDRIDGQIATDSDKEADTNVKGEEEKSDTASLAAFLKSATGGTSDDLHSTIISQDGTEPPAGLGSSLRVVRSRINRTNMFPI